MIIKRDLIKFNRFIEYKLNQKYIYLIKVSKWAKILNGDFVEIKRDSFK